MATSLTLGVLLVLSIVLTNHFIVGEHIEKKITIKLGAVEPRDVYHGPAKGEPDDVDDHGGVAAHGESKMDSHHGEEEAGGKSDPEDHNDDSGPCPFRLTSEYYETCSMKHASLEKFIEGKSKASGADIVKVFNQFCAATDKIHHCVEGKMTANKCAGYEIKNFKKLAKKSEFFCNGHQVSDYVSHIYNDIPAIPLEAHLHPCVNMAYHRKQLCVTEIDLSLNMEDVHDIQTKMSREEGTLLCTLKGFEGGCSVKDGLLTSTIANADTVIPPHLGVNVTYILESMETFFEQHEE